MLIVYNLGLLLAVTAIAGIAGTDYHHTTNAPTAGIMTNEPITNEKELLAILRSGGYRTFGEIAPKSEE